MRIAIIGCGNMGTSLAKRLGPLHYTFLYDRDKQWTQELAQMIHGTACQSIKETLDQAQLIFLAIKPQNLKEIHSLIQLHLREDQTIISLLAGTPLAVLRDYFPHSTLIRIMPNLAICYGTGIIGITPSTDFTDELKSQLEKLFIPLGHVYWLEENKMNALTSLASSGPAFILTLLEAMVEAGIFMGFQAKEAQEITIRMLQGCLTLIQQTEIHPAELKWQIASPNGTTIAGLRVLERENMRSGMIEALLAAYQKAKEMTQNHNTKKEA